MGLLVFPVLPVPSLEGLYIRRQSAGILLVITQKPGDLRSNQSWFGRFQGHRVGQGTAPNHQHQTHHQTK